MAHADDCATEFDYSRDCNCGALDAMDDAEVSQ